MGLFGGTISALQAARERDTDPFELLDETVGWWRLLQAKVASVNVVEFRSGSEVATSQAARGGSPRVSASGSGEASPAIASICM
jgi:hypothetical protein